jgi:hypothetical protein
MSVYIYRIYSDKGELQYYGSTKHTILHRFSDHKTKYERNINECTSFKVFQEYGVENCYVELLEKVTEELRKEREAYYIRNFECVNKTIPARTWREYHKEYNEQNKVQLAEQRKAYAEQNKEKIAEYQKEYREKNKVKIAEQRKALYQRKKISSNNIDNAKEEKKSNAEEI